MNSHALGQSVPPPTPERKYYLFAVQNSRGTTRNDVYLGEFFDMREVAKSYPSYVVIWYNQVNLDEYNAFLDYKDALL